VYSMPISAGDSLLLAAFATLAVGSVALKAKAPEPDQSLTRLSSGPVETGLIQDLRSRGFTTEERAFPTRNPIIFARRGECVLAVRKAWGAESLAKVYSEDARSIGPIRYLYRGKTYASPPTVMMRIGRFGADLQRRVGLETPVPVPVALATTPACGTDQFGLDNVRVGA
jgi:hypothetical protein